MKARRRSTRLMVGALVVAAWALLAVPSAGATWTLGPSAPVPPGPPNGDWGAVSCLSAADCWVAGSATNADGLVAEHWNGSVWRVVNMPLPGGTSVQITSIGCRSSASCIAVGTASGGANASVDYVWNGSAWSAGPSVDAPSYDLAGVSCAPGGRCVVVGDYVPFGSKTQYALAAWWTPFSSLVPIGSVRTAGGPGASLARASCPKPGGCVAVGSSASHAISINFTGSAWSATTMPDGVDAFGNPSPVNPADVSCASLSACVAVGYYPDETGLGASPALLTWNGTTWTLVTGLPIDFPHGVSCTSASDCTITGENGEREGNSSFAAAAHWDGTHATSDTVYDDPSWSSYFLGVACPTSRACVAAGGQFIVDGPFSEAQPLMENSAAGAFSRSATPPPSGAGAAGFNGIACASASNCIAVGSAASPVNEHSAEGDPIPYAAHWDGSLWTPRSPARAPGQKQILGAVSCPTSSACVAVGGTEPAQTYPPAYTPLAERWDGSSWTRLPVPAGLSGQWTSVSCVSATHCVALGSGEFEVWNGSTWTAQPQANPSDTLYSVSCTTLDACTALGWADGPVTFVERWNGTAWTEQAPSAQAPFVAVSCARSTACQAISVSPVDAMGWDGMRWTNEPLSAPGSGTGQPYSAGVDCAAPRACEAVGMIVPSGTPFAYGWDGASWQRQALSSSLQNSGLDAVSCPARAACFAVGSNTTVLARYASSPTAKTSAPSGVSGAAARLRGVVNPQGATVSSCVFRWGATTAYGHSAPCAQAVGSGFAPVPVSATLTGLVPGSTYHYRLVVSSPAGGAYGADWVFRTAGSGGFTFGNAAVGDGVTSFTANAKRANAYTLTQPASVSSLSVYLQPSGTAGTQDLRGLIYSDSLGTPGALRAASRTLTFQSTGRPGWYRLTFASPVALSAGRYWIGILTGASNAVAGWRYDVVPNSRVYNINPFSAGPSNPFGSGTTDDFLMSLYANATPATASARGAFARPTAHRTSARFHPRRARRARPGRIR